jgi:hypothetical protein
MTFARVDSSTASAERRARVPRHEAALHARNLPGVRPCCALLLLVRPLRAACLSVASACLHQIASLVSLNRGRATTPRRSLISISLRNCHRAVWREHAAVRGRHPHGQAQARVVPRLPTGAAGGALRAFTSFCRNALAGSRTR